MTTKRRWLWVLLFASVAVLLGTLATTWNIVLVMDYEKLRALTRSLSIPPDLHSPSTHLMVKMVLGTLGFLAALGLTVLIFVRLLQEMRLNQQQSEFLASISHELKTPIAALELSSGLLRDHPLTPQETTTLWNSHQTELNRLRDQVETLLEAARFQTHPLGLKRQPVHLETWLCQTLDRWNALLGPEGQLRREGPALELQAQLDPRGLDLIANDLLSNAKKFAKGPPRIVVRTERISVDRPFLRKKWLVEVEDQGWGFDPSYSKQIFERFSRFKTPAPYSIPGTGLGLYLAFRTSRSMGLTLRGSSRGIGLGARFTLEGPEPEALP